MLVPVLEKNNKVSRFYRNRFEPKDPTLTDLLEP